MRVRPVQSVIAVVLAAFAMNVAAESVNPKDDSTVTLNDLVDKLKGSGVTIDSPAFVGESNSQAGIFSGYDFLFGSSVDEGVVFSTGDVVDVVGANSADSTTTQFNTAINNDPLFGSVRDLVTLSFNVTPVENTLIVEYVFGSEEYNEYVGQGFNDFIRIFVDGNNCAVTANGLIVSIDAVNNGSNSFLYNDNRNPPTTFNTEMDGFTKTVSCRYPVTPGVSVPVVIGMADDGDAQYDSWAFFKAQSLRSEPSDEFGDAPDTYQTLSASNGAGHTIIEGVYMGTMPSGDDNGFVDGFDDSLGNAADDTSDDGVLTFPNLDADTDTSYSITVNATSINGKGGRIIGWIDFDRDGQFQTDEASNIATLATNTYETDVTLTWPVIGGAGPDIAMGTSFARIRLVNDDEIITSGDFAGIFLSGEVEDYQFQITGLADITPPVVQIDVLPTAVSSNISAYPVTGICTAGDNNVTVAVTGATPANQSVVCSGGGTWTASFDVSAIADGINVIVVDASQDDANSNLSNATQVTADKDVLAPSVDIQNEPAFANNGGPFTITIEFSEDVTGFAVGDITVARGVASNLVAIDGSTYTADITPTSGTGTLRIDIAANVAQDIFNNNNTAAPQATVTLTNAVDATRPVITLLGSTPVDIVMGTLYTDAGATALDNVDGDITGSIVVGGDVVDINTIGIYTITYDAVDAAGNAAVQVTRTVNVTPNGIFTIEAIADASVNENSTYTGVTPVITGFPIGAVTYTLGGADAALFAINSSTGVVSMVARDFESPADAGANNVYDLSITATDANGNNDSEAWTVTVQDLIEVSVFTIDAISNANVNENSAYTSVTPSITGTPIGAVFYSLGGADAGLFTINATNGVVSMIARDFESPADAFANNVYDLSITVTDADGNSDSEAWSVTVQDVIEVASFTIDAIADANINENAVYTGVTPSITGSPIGAVTYTLGGTDAGLFTINSGTGVVGMVVRDFESPVDANTDNVYVLSITVTDADGNSDSEGWSVTVQDMVEAASFTIDAIADTNVNENAVYTGVTPSITGTPIGVVTYTLGGADAGLFTINSGTGVVSMVARDYENPADNNTDNIYVLSITVTDADGNSDSEDWTVTVDDVVEAASFTIDAIASTSVNENAVYTGVTPSITGTPIGAVTYSLGGADAGLFTINSGTGVVSMVARDFESPVDAFANNVYDLSITAIDADGNSDSEAWSVTVQDVVEVSAISIDAIADTSVNENSIYTGVTPAITGTPIGAVTYALGGTDAGLFTINSGTGVVSMIARDFESPADAGVVNVYNLTITATDADGNNDTEAWSVTVQDVVEVAAFTIDAIADTMVNENALYTGVTPSLSGAAPIGTLTYTLGGTDTVLFAINAANGVVSMIARDFEAPADAGGDNVYDLSITATDTDGNSDSEAWSVTVQDVVEVSAISIDAIADTSVNENSIYTGVTPAITGTPIGVVTYSLGGTDAADFTINTSTGVVSMVARDFENAADGNADNVYELSITVTDADGNSDSEAWSVTVDDMIEAASFTIDAINNASVNENTIYTGVTPSITGAPIGAVTYSLGGTDAGLFTINSGTGVVSMVARDFEAPADAGGNNIYDLSIAVTDADGNTDSEAWSVTVQDVVEAASFTIDAIAAANVNENAIYTGVTPSITGTPIGAVTYALGGTDAGLFTINSGTGVASMVIRDYESPADADTDNVYELNITATDSDGNTDSENWVVTVNDVVEAANFTIGAIANTNVNENAVYTGVTPSITGAPIGAFTYSLGGADAADFTINTSTGVVSMVARDYESPADANADNVYELSITVTDADGNSDSEAWSVTVQDVVEAASFTIDAIAAANVNENAIYTGVTPSITGTPIGAITYSLGGTGAVLFTINSGTGVVSMIARDFESPADADGDNIYDLSITATDADGNNDTEAWSVTVQDVVEAASFTIDAINDVSVNENTIYTGVTPSITGAPIGAVTYSLGGADAGQFSINSGTGVVSMVSRDFENATDANTDNVYELSITVTDADGNSDSEDWSVTVQDVVEAASFTIDAIAAANVNENAIYTGVTPSITGTPIGSVTYTLGGADAGLFTINSGTGVVSMVARDFESPSDAGADNVYDLSIMATDADGNSDSEAWSVTVDDVVETASFTIDAVANVNINENTPYTSVTPIITGTPIGAVTYTLGGADATDFTINTSTGVVGMVVRDFENPSDTNTDNVYELTITATDSDGNADSEIWTVTVNDVVEAASFTIDAVANVNVNENTPYTSVTPNITGTPIGVVTYSLGGADAADFTINTSTGVVNMIARDYEGPVDDNTDNAYELTITATDTDSNAADQSWIVTVADVVEVSAISINAIADTTVNENSAYISVTPVITGVPVGAVTYSLAGNDAALFSINSSNGVVSMVARNFESPIDAGADNVYDLSITVTDADGNTDSEAWSVSVLDVIETASFTIDVINGASVDENAVYTSVTPAITGSPIGSLSYTLGGIDAGLFSINASTGVVSMVARDFELPADADTNNIYDLSITATDSDGNADSENWSVTVNDVVEADVTLPVITLSGVSPITIERGLGYFDIGATATDNIDGNITANIITVNPVDADTVGSYTVTYDVSDAAGNAAIQVTRTVIVEDTIAPGVSISNQPAGVNNLNAFNVTFQFTEVVSGFVITDISVINATVSNFVNVGGVGDTYTADIIPTGAGDITIGVNSSVAQDASANNNTAAVSVVTAFDNTAPDVQITIAPDINIANQSAVIISGTCDVGDGDVSVFLTIGALPMFANVACVPGNTWSTSFDLSTVSDGIDHIDIGAQQTDGAGNVGSAPFVKISKDTVRPNVQIQNVPAYVNTSEFIVTFSFDEAVSGFDSTDISVINGSVNAASFNVVDAQTYTAGITASGAGDVTLNVASAVAQDLLGNTNNAAAPEVAIFDNTAPVVTVTDASVVNAANDDNYNVAGDCETGDGYVTVSIAGATPVSQDVSCTAGSWSAVFDVVAITDGNNAVTVNASQTDAAGNTGVAVAVQVDKDVLITVPTVDLLVTNSATPVITGTADEGTSNVVVVAGATYTVTAVAGNLWSLDTAVATPDSGAFVLVDGANEVVVTSTDAAGNSELDVSNNEVTLTLDDDNDGIPNAVECPSGPPYDNSCTDTDGDGTPDFQETDSDNDGIPDASEAGLDSTNPIDSDGDGIPDYRDSDSDNDGIDDALEGVIDTDGDGIPDYVDVGSTGDSDGDGIPDLVECPVYPNCANTDGDGSPDYLDTDSDNDTLDDAVEAGVDPTSPIDTDSDGTPDYRDTDSDNEGAGDSVEGIVDIDGDGIPDYVDADTAGPGAGDSDGDGIADNIECALYPLCADSDTDGTPDYMEVDSDDDGILDIDEAGSALNDADSDGIDDTFDIDITGLANGLDLNGDGIDDTQPLDTDGDGTPDYQDTDSDGDGIDDIVECPAGVPCPDADGDGITDQLDASNGDATGSDITGSGDSDGDGISDANECPAGLPCPDADQDGVPDYMDDNSTDGPIADFDNDGLPNYLDPDDDNDSIPDVAEDPDFDADNNPFTNPLDSDLDGTPDYLDTDSDNDGLSDSAESGASGNDSDGDNIDDSYDIDMTGGTDANSDGIDDNVLPRDSDGDNLPDYLDTVFDGGQADSDNDGIPDEVECPVFPTDCPDTDNDGTPDFLETDSDGDGLNDSDEAGSLNSGVLLDTDGDGTPDYRDLDSDGDGIDDATEGLSADTDGDGIPDALDADSSGAPFGGDSDGDGVADMDECNTYPDCKDSNNDGTPDYMDASASPYDANASINTGLNGVGGNGPLSLLFIITAFGLRRKTTQKK